jgi:hypothetical protein
MIGGDPLAKVRQQPGAGGAAAPPPPIAGIPPVSGTRPSHPAFGDQPATQQPTTQTAAQTPATTRPTTTAAAGDGSGAVGLNNLGGYLERMLGTPSAFGMPQVKQVSNYLKGERDATYAEGVSNVNTDAAQRGAYYSSIPTKGVAGLEGDRMRAEAGHGAQLAEMMARFQDQGRSGAVGQALQFMGLGQQGAAQHASGLGNLGSMMLGQGNQGGVDMNTILATLGAQGGGGAGGLDPSVVSLITQLMGAGGGGANAAAAQPTRTVSTPASTSTVINNPDVGGWS